MGTMTPTAKKPIFLKKKKDKKRREKEERYSEFWNSSKMAKVGMHKMNRIHVI
jgi:hypothetical protein